MAQVSEGEPFPLLELFPDARKATFLSIWTKLWNISSGAAREGMYPR